MEYLVVCIETSAEEMTERLNELARDGWRVVKGGVSMCISGQTTNLNFAVLMERELANA